MYKVRYPGPIAAVDVPDLGREGPVILDDDDNVVSPGGILRGEVFEIEDKARAEHAVAQGFEPVDWEPEGDPAGAQLQDDIAALLDGNQGQVIDRIAGDPVRARVALEAEKAGQNRTRLVEKLTALAGQGD